MRFLSGVSLAAAALLASSARSAETPFAWKSVNVQGMGYVTGLVVHPKPPHDIYIRTDVGGAYRFDRGARRWIPLLDRWGTANPGIFGVESIAVDPSDPNTVHVFTGLAHEIKGSASFDYGEVLVSHTRGAYWEATGLADSKLYIGGNDAARGTTGERLAVDPNRPGRVYVGSRKDGLWIRDAAVPWRRAVGPPASTDQPGTTFVVLDARRVFAGVTGSGVWMSTDAGETWSVQPGPSNPVRAAVGSDGTLVVTYGGDEGSRSGAVRRYRAGMWKDITPLSMNDGYSGVAVDPRDPRHLIVCANHDQTIYRSTDQGDSWTRVTVDGAAAQPAYYATYSSGNQVNSAKAAGWGNGSLSFDPVKPGRVFQTNGYGVIATEDISADRTTWAWWMSNLEELVVQNVKVPPLDGGADLFSVVADMVGFRHGSRNAVPDATISKFEWVAQGTSVAYSAQQPQYAAFVGWDETNVNRALTGWTSDNGKTWAPFADTSPGSGGIVAMAAGDPGNLVWAPSRKALPVYSRDGGNTWAQCRLGSGPLPASWQMENEWWSGQILAADAVAPATFYYYVQGDVYGSTDGGATWSRKATIPGVQWTIKVNLVPNPAKVGDLWISFRPNANQALSLPLLRSTNAGATFSRVPGLDACNFVAFGKGNTADTPYVYIHGRASGATADTIYKSEDLGATWVRVSDPEQNQFGSISSLESDMRRKDLVYVGTGGRGILYGYGPGSGISGPAFTAAGVTNAANGQGGAVAPGEIVTIYGERLGPAALTAMTQDETGFVSTEAGDAQVFFDSFPRPMIYASAAQTSAIVPFGLAGRSTTSVQVAHAGVLSPPVEVSVVPALPALFTADSSGSGQIVAVNTSTGLLNSAANPAGKGEIVTFYVTGDGQTQPEGLDGWSGFAAPPRVAGTPSATIGGTSAEVPYAGAAPGFVMGVSQWNVVVPGNAPSGPAVPVLVSVGGIVSPAGATLAVR